MPQTPIAFLEDEDRSGAATGIAAVEDDLFNTSGDNIEFRNDMRKIALAYMWTEFAAFPPVLGTINSAAIRGNPIRLTRGIALNYLAEGQINDYRAAPLGRIRSGDDVSFTAYEADEGGVAHFLGLVLFLSNAPIPLTTPRPTNLIHRCTVGATSAAAWKKLQLTEQDPLPAGIYYMNGARVESATAVAARFVFKGMESRPGVIPVTRSQDNLHPMSRAWGASIPFRIPGDLPKLEMLATASETPGDVTLFLHDPNAITKEGVGRG